MFGDRKIENRTDENNIRKVRIEIYSDVSTDTVKNFKMYDISTNAEMQEVQAFSIGLTIDDGYLEGLIKCIDGIPDPDIPAVEYEEVVHIKRIDTIDLEPDFRPKLESE